MTSELQQYLDIAGFQPRGSQTELYEHLILADQRGVIAQAGTGTGKSAAIIAAAANRTRVNGRQSIIVTPTLTLMNQYRDGDLPIAREAYPELKISELRGKAHYHCEMTADGFRALDLEYYGGCGGLDAGCSMRGAGGHTEECPRLCPEEHESGWFCGYQVAKAAAMSGDIVVTNADMLIVNDKILFPLQAEIFDMEGALFVDEAHTLEAKLRDWASRSLHWKTAERFHFAGNAGAELSRWIRAQEKNLSIRDTRGFPRHAIAAIADAEMPPMRPKDGLAKQRETLEACARIQNYLNDPHDHAVLHVGQGALKMDWINIAASAGELLQQRSFGLVSATVPRTMASTLGVSEAPFIDVGHPFDYGSQAWLGVSPYGGDYKSAQQDGNLDYRLNEVRGLLERARGGALILFSSFRDLEIVSAELRPWLMHELGLKVFTQERDMEAADRQKMAEEFRADGNAVLFGSESFATGFDVPGDALRLVVLWKLPYPAVDPVSNAIRSLSFDRYNDMMKVRAVQAMGRLIRRETDRGIVWIADSRGRRLIDAGDPLTSHIPQFARL